MIPDPKWRALIVLARWGGLRIPSEALTLEWRDVLWDRGVFIVRSPKTAHHRDGGIRMGPLFAEVREALDELWARAPEGATRVFTRFAGVEQNLRTQLARYCERAGVRPWGKPFQNMRASRATELADLFPSHVCAAWLGHTEKIAEAFYRQVTQEHLAKALALPEAAQNPAQYVHAASCTVSQDRNSGNPDSGMAPKITSSCEIVYKRTVVLQEHERFALGRAEEPGPMGCEPIVGGLGCEREIGRAAFFLGGKQHLLDPCPARSGRCIRRALFPLSFLSGLRPLLFLHRPHLLAQRGQREARFAVPLLNEFQMAVLLQRGEACRLAQDRFEQPVALLLRDVRR